MGSIVGDELSGQEVISGLPKKRRKKPGETEQLNSNRFALTQGLATTLLTCLRTMDQPAKDLLQPNLITVRCPKRK